MVPPPFGGQKMSSLQDRHCKTTAQPGVV